MADAISQETEDAIVNLLCTRLVEKDTVDGQSVFSAVMANLNPTDRGLVEASLDRHATRRRAKGEPGW